MHWQPEAIEQQEKDLDVRDAALSERETVLAAGELVLAKKEKEFEKIAERFPAGAVGPNSDQPYFGERRLGLKTKSCGLKAARR